MGYATFKSDTAFFTIGRIFLETKLRRMDADYYQAGIFALCSPGFYIQQFSQAVNARVSPEVYQAGIFVLCSPGFYIQQFSQAVNARVSPEVDQDDLAAQRLAAQRSDVEPGHPAIQIRHWSFASRCRCNRDDPADEGYGATRKGKSLQ